MAPTSPIAQAVRAFPQIDLNPAGAFAAFTVSCLARATFETVDVGRKGFNNDALSKGKYWRRGGRNVVLLRRGNGTGRLPDHRCDALPGQRYRRAHGENHA